VSTDQHVEQRKRPRLTLAGRWEPRSKSTATDPSCSNDTRAQLSPRTVHVRDDDLPKVMDASCNEAPTEWLSEPAGRSVSGSPLSIASDPADDLCGVASSENVRGNVPSDDAAGPDD
jgi:hypothetical protein